MHFLPDDPAQSAFKRFTLTLYMMTQRVIYQGLIIPPASHLIFKPLNNIGVKSNGNTFFRSFNYCPASAFTENHVSLIVSSLILSSLLFVCFNKIHLMFNEVGVAFVFVPFKVHDYLYAKCAYMSSGKPSWTNVYQVSS